MRTDFPDPTPPSVATGGEPSRRAALAATLILTGISTSACAAGTEPTALATDEWVVTRKTEGNVTTVRNVSGSRWGGTATLREELSIGVLEGPDEYMFSGPSGYWLTDDEIYVVESREHRVRVYDREGTHRRTFGREGDGPGEFRNPRSITIAPDGRLFIINGGGSRRISVVDAQGNSLDTWALGQFTIGRFFTPLADGRFFIDAYKPPEGPMTGTFNPEPAVQVIGPDGSLGELRDVPVLGEPVRLDTTIMGRPMTINPPFAPNGNTSFAVAGDGSVVVGFPDDYRFEIRHPDGRVTRVSKHWTPVPISDAELDDHIATRVAGMRRNDPDWEWPGGWRPGHKPAYTTILTDHSNRVWISREAISEPIEDCSAPADLTSAAASFMPCWRAERILDVFDMEGNYLGELHRPTGVVFSSPFIRDDVFLASIEDDLGTILVKLYRIVVPEPEDSP